ncbi:MAG: hypothetical protein AABY22_32800 [Nanoarchaeota archaeon]
MEINTKCCKKEMTDLGDLEYCDMQLNTRKCLICGECGRAVFIDDMELDDEELLIILNDNATEENKLKESKIYKELTYEEKQETLK